MEYYRASEDQGEAFDTLANRCIYDKNWNTLDALIADYERQSPGDIRIAKRDAAAAWEREDYVTYIRRANQMLEDNGPHAVASYDAQPSKTIC